MKRYRAAKTLVAALALAVMLCPVRTLVQPSAPASAAPASTPALSSPDPHDRAVLFLPGVCPDKTTTRLLAQIPAISTWVKNNLLCGPLDDAGRVIAAERAEDTFAPLITHLKQVAGFAWTPLYFSYSSDLTSYTPTDSQQPLRISTQLLQGLIRSKLCADPHLTFDLVGHSLGGAVAADWAVSEATQPLDCPNGTSIAVLPHVHGIVTFDSPIQGVKGLAFPLDHAETWAAQALGDKVGSSDLFIGVVAGALISYYAAALTSPVDADISAAAPLINDPKHGLLSQLNNHVLSIGNQGDIFVDTDATWVGAGRQESSDNNPLVDDCTSGTPDPVCHSTVLSDPAALQWAVNMIVHQTLPTDQAGGSWITATQDPQEPFDPDHNIVLDFSAHAYVLHRLQTIDRVDFTMQWQDGSDRTWATACTDSHQAPDDDFGCTAHVNLPRGFTGSSAHLKVGFDISTNSGPVRQSPNGIRTILVSMPPR